MLKGVKDCTMANMPEALQSELSKIFHLMVLKVNMFRMTEQYMQVTKK